MPSRDVAVLRDTLARIARLREALADGELDLAELVAEDLELDLQRALDAGTEAAA